jgi:mannose-6-phosphate isomerase-like protein (cupin superfamily)
MPGATQASRLKVYDTAGPDGQRGGTPHVHLLCTEMYFVLEGSGAVEMMDANGFTRVDLHPYAALVFTSGTIHRLINPLGNLTILVIMQNSGLPERGDNVVCFTDEWLASDEKYAEAMHVRTLADAYQRRNRGVDGFLHLKAAFEVSLQSGQNTLQKFYEQAIERTTSLRQRWKNVIQQGALSEAQTSLEQLEALYQGDMGYLLQAQHSLIPAGETTINGFCGHLHRYFEPEGIQEP